MNLRRFVIVAICAALAAFGLFYIVFFLYPDVPPPTRIQTVWNYVWMVYSWPLIVVWSMSDKDPPWGVFILSWFATGLFWAFVVELLFKLKIPGKGKISA